MYCNRRLVAKLDRGVWSLARTHTVNPVRHVVLIFRLSTKGSPIGLVDLFGEVANDLLGLAIRHVRLPPAMLDRSIAAQDVLTQSVMAVVESRLPGHNDIVREF